jgi:peptidoglycan/LPS O-acetylase OafA/YrhL
MAGAKLIPSKIPDLSYGMYVYHIPMILFINAVYKPENAFLTGTVLTIALVLFSTASWYLIEKPALKLKNRQPPAPAGQPSTS